MDSDTFQYVAVFVAGAVDDVHDGGAGGQFEDAGFFDGGHAGDPVFAGAV